MNASSTRIQMKINGNRVNSHSKGSYDTIFFRFSKESIQFKNGGSIDLGMEIDMIILSMNIFCFDVILFRTLDLFLCTTSKPAFHTVA